MTFLVTGANGFVGAALCAQLGARGESVRAAVRLHDKSGGSVQSVVGIGMNGAYDGSPALMGVEAVIHLAARVHVMRDSTTDSFAAFRKVNVEKTLELAAQAAAAGVRRFVFVSSVKVHGEATLVGHPFDESDPPAPRDAYAISKWEAEQGLRQIAASTGLEVVIIRPPLVYGPGVKANFAALMRAVDRGLPLPLGAVNNLRSLVGLDNLVDFIITCTHHPAAANQTFLVSDGADVSTPDLVRAIGRAAGRPVRLLSVPVGLLLALASLVGKRGVMDRLGSSLQIDISKAREILQWSPPVALDEGLRRAFNRSNA